MKTTDQNKKKKIAVIGTVGLPAKYGGFETLTEHLVGHLGREFDITVYCSGRKYPRSQRMRTFLGAKLVYLPFDANGIWSIPYDAISILHALFYADVLLVLGVSGGILFPLVKCLTRKKLIVSIDGIEWKRDKWNKAARWYLWWAEKMGVKYSHADIADNESIQDYTAYRYGSLSTIIEYGADHTIKSDPGAAHLEHYPFLAAPYAFNVCRIEPENNVKMILEAFSGNAPYPLVMVGNWAHSDYGRTLKALYGGTPGIHLLDPIYDQKELDVLRGNATLYIHGHSAGGTNPSLVEAMFLGLPVLAFGVPYNRTTTENKAFYFSTAADLRRQLEQLTPEQLQNTSSVLREIALRRYTWSVVAGKYGTLVRNVLEAPGKISVKPQSAETNITELIDLELGHLAYPAYFYEKR